MKRRLLLILLSLVPSIAFAQTHPAAATSPVAAPLRVAVLDFDANTPANPDLGKQIGEALATTLSSDKNLQLVDRAALPRALQELELNLTGLTDPSNAVKVGHLVGAQILVTGRAFILDKQLCLTAKMIGTETSLVESVAVKSKEQAEVGPLIGQLGKEVADHLQKSGAGLAAPPESAENDPVPALTAKLAKLKLPIVAVRITEQHTSQQPAARVDPAVQTEVTLLLKQAGFTVVEGDDKDLARGGVTVVIRGEAFSEFAARIGDLVSCSARTEVKVVPLNGSKVLLADRETARATDLSENIAAKLALQKTGRVIGIRLLEHFAQTAAPKP